ncbi:MAG: DUF6531 domain-containing protein, partial [Planctomycetota bacterium]
MSDILRKDKLEIAERYLLPKCFYFLIENTEPCVSGETGGSSEAYHVEVALYRVNDKGNAIDKEDGKQVSALVYRSWVKGENDSFHVVPGDGDVDFESPDMEAFPIEGCSEESLPALVILETRGLEQDREYIGYARIFDGLQWGPWKRVPQTRLDIVDESGNPLRDVSLAGPMPEIRAEARSDRIARDDQEMPIQIGTPKPWTEGSQYMEWWVFVRDVVPIKTAFINGRKVKLIHGGSRDVEGSDWEFVDKKEGKYYAAKFKVNELEEQPKITEGCQRIEIVAKNELGNRSCAVKLYRPEYSSDGKVLQYRRDGDSKFGVEPKPKPESPHLFRIRYHAVPYRLPMKPAGNKAQKSKEQAAGEKKTTKPELAADVLIGNDPTPKKVLLRQVSGAKDQGPWLGPDVKAPAELKPKVEDNAKTKSGSSSAAAPMKVIISVKITLDTSTGEVLAEKQEAEIKKKYGNAWLWESEPLLLVEGSRRGGNALPAEPGDLLQAHLVLRWQEKAKSSQSAAGSQKAVTDRWRVSSPKAVAMGTRPISVDSEAPLPAVKNGDVIRVEAFTIKAEPKPDVKVKTKHDHDTDNEKKSPFALREDVSLQKVQSHAIEGESFDALLINLDESGKQDKGKRDEVDVEVETKVGLEPSILKPSQAPADKAAKLRIPEPPGRVGIALRSKTDQKVRLITQEYMPQDMVSKRKAETRHQILPYGFLLIRVGSEEALKDPKGQLCLMANRFPTLEITKRWYIGEKPSIQPAFAGTNPRVGGPGTHRVQGLNQKLRDGSVYVHNGEFFQAAEDLHIPGKVMDLTFRRTYMSHSLFTSPIGRNWDWLGNMRLVEMLNGDVYLMNGEASIEFYECLICPPEVEDIEAIVQARKFDYEKLWETSPYWSPAGVYRSLVKAKPVQMAGMAKPDENAEKARFYLVGKHGTVWTFVEDLRFQTNREVCGDLGDGDKANEHEPLPGVQAHYLLVCIHDRRQANYIKLQRDAGGLVKAIIDDYGRVTRLEYSSETASADRLLSTIEDFAGREITPTHKERDLESVEGPEVRTKAEAPKDAKAATTKKADNTEKLKFAYEYAQKAGKGPRHKLTAVTDPTRQPLLVVGEWDSGRVKKQTVLKKFHYAGKYESTKVSYEESYSGYSGAVLKKGTVTNSHTYIVRSDPCQEFAEVAAHGVLLRSLRQGIGYAGYATSFFRYNVHGEVTDEIRPKGNWYSRNYETERSEAGNLKGEFEKGVVSDAEIRGALTAAKASGPTTAHVEKVLSKLEAAKAQTIAETQYDEYDRSLNLPKRITELAYVRNNERAQLVSHRRYDEEGNLLRVETPQALVSGQEQAAGEAKKGQAEKGSFIELEYIDSQTYPDTPSQWGLLGGTTDRRLENKSVRTAYCYRRKGSDSVPGDAHDKADKLVAIWTVPSDCYRTTGLYGQGITAYGVSLLEVYYPKGGNIRLVANPCNRADLLQNWDGSTYGMSQSQKGLVTVLYPDKLGYPEKEIDPDGIVKTRTFNELGQLLQDENRVTYEYERGYPAARWTRAPGNAKQRSTATFKYDALGNLERTDSNVKGLWTEYEYDPNGNPIIEKTARSQTAYAYDARGLLQAARIGKQLAGTEGDILEIYAHDANGNLVYHEDACGWCEGWRYTADRLQFVVDKRGLVRHAKPGHGGAVYGEVLYQPESVRKANESFRTAAQQGKEGSIRSVKKAVRDLAKWMASESPGPPQNAKYTVLSKIIYWRDQRGRVNRQEHLWNPGGGDASKHVYYCTKWSDSDLALEQWVEISDASSAKGGAKVGLRTVRDYDSLGRTTSQYFVPSDFKGQPTKSRGQQVTSWSYGVHGFVRTKVPDGTEIRQVADRQSSGDYDIVESWTWRSGTGKDVLIERQAFSKTGMLRARETILRPSSGSIKAKSSDQALVGRTKVFKAIDGLTLRWEELAYDAALRVTGGRIATRRGLQKFKVDVSKPTEIMEPPLVLEHTNVFDENKGQLSQEKTFGKDGGGIIREYKQSCVFGPRLVRQSAGGKGVQGAGYAVESAVRYDSCGNKTDWTDANGTSFHAVYDGKGEVISLVAKHPESGDGKKTKTEKTETTKKIKALHRRVFIRDAMGRVVYMLNDQMDYLVAVKDEKNPDKTVKLKPSGKGRSLKVVSEFAYDMLGHIYSEEQSFPDYAQAKRKVGYTRSATGFCEEREWPKVTGGKSFTVSNKPEKMGLPSTVKLNEDGGNITALVNSVEYGDDLLPNKCDLASPQKSAGYKATLTHNGCRVKLSQTFLQHTAFERVHHRKYPLSDQTRREDTTTTTGVVLEEENKEAKREYYARFETPKCDTVSQKGVLTYDRRTLTRTRDLRGEAPAATISRNYSFCRESFNGLRTLVWQSREAEVDAHDQTVGGAFGVSNAYELDPALQARRKVHVRSSKRLKANWRWPLVTTPLERPADMSVGGEPAPRDYTLVLDRNGRTWEEPGATINRNVFGEPVVIADPDSPGGKQQSFLRYDASGRLIVKDVPARVTMSPAPLTDAVVIDVGLPPAKKISGHVHKSNLAEAVKHIIDACKGQWRAGISWTIRIHSEIAPAGGKKTVGIGEALSRLRRAQIQMRKDWEGWKARAEGAHTENWNVFGSITFESASDKWVKVQGNFSGDMFVVLTKLVDVTLRRLDMVYEGKPSEVTALDSDNLTIDGCQLRTLTVWSSCPGMKIQNCVFKWHDKKPEKDRLDRSIKIQAQNSSILIAHNLFPAQRYEPVLLKNPTMQESYVVVVNNIQEIGKGRHKDHKGICVTKFPWGKQSPNVFVACNLHLKRPWQDAVDGKGTRNLGTGDLPTAVGGTRAVLWDRFGRLRDTKTPTIGPVEMVPGDERAVHRYVYDGAQLAQRETYRT